MRKLFRSDGGCDGVVAGWRSEAVAAAYRLARDRHAAEDLAHDTLVRTMEDPPAGAPARAGGWIQRICRNLRVDGWRAESQWRRSSLQIPKPPAGATGEEALLAHERRREVRWAVATLPRAQRRAVILRYHGSWSFDRIAARLRMPEATARTQVHRALAALRARVAALRVLFAPGALALKPALAVLIVLAADPRPLDAARRTIPAKPATATATTTAAATTAATATATATARPSVASAPARRFEEARRALADAQSAVPGDAITVVAKPARSRSSSPAPAPAPAGAVLRLDFEDDEVTADLKRPDEDGPIEAVERARHPSLIELRRQFLPEIIKTLEQL